VQTDSDFDDESMTKEFLASVRKEEDGPTVNSELMVTFVREQIARMRGIEIVATLTDEQTLLVHQHILQFANWSVAYNETLRSTGLG
jgi:hypothetical protein